MFFFILKIIKFMELIKISKTTKKNFNYVLLFIITHYKLCTFFIFRV